jgi:predicted DNA-binding transcriptional regulator AlpA
MQFVARTYLDKHALARRYSCHPNSVPRRIREKTFPPPTLWLGPASPRWEAAECDRWDDLLSTHNDARTATSKLLAERQERLRQIS